MTLPAMPVDPRLADCRRLFLRGYELPVRIGVHDFERGAPQRMRFHVDLWVPLSHSTPRADAITEVVDYDFVRLRIRERVARGHVRRHPARDARAPRRARCACRHREARRLPRLRGGRRRGLRHQAARPNVPMIGQGNEPANG